MNRATRNPAPLTATRTTVEPLGLGWACETFTVFSGSQVVGQVMVLCSGGWYVQTSTPNVPAEHMKAIRAEMARVPAEAAHAA